ncbi:hypothetical protein RI367_008702, partial [Sorochytrium milnesiophthora]
MCGKLDKYLERMCRNQVYLLATVLDPRYKISFIHRREALLFAFNITPSAVRAVLEEAATARDATTGDTDPTADDNHEGDFFRLMYGAP